MPCCRVIRRERGSVDGDALCDEKRGSVRNRKFMDIFIYGAGHCGRKVISTLKRYPELRIVGYIDQNPNQTVDGYPLISREQYAAQPDEMPLIIALANPTMAVEIAQVFRRLGKKNIYYYLRKDRCTEPNFFRAECLKLDELPETALPYAEMHVADFCNLNCKGCTHFSALFDRTLPDRERRIQDIRTLAKIFPRILCFALMGGEPLLNPEIGDYLTETRELLPETEIQLVTNGLLLLTASDKIFHCLEENRITVSISEYAPTHERMHGIERRLQSFNIDYVVRDYDIKQRFGKPLSRKSVEASKRHCLSYGCVNICDGKIARCPTVMYVEKLNQRFLEFFPTDGILELSPTWDAKDLLLELQKQIPLCTHCSGSEIAWEPCENPVTVDSFVDF